MLYQLYMANPVADAVILLQRFFWFGVNQADIGSLPPEAKAERSSRPTCSSAA